MALYFIPLGSLPLPTVISIFFVSPLLITLLSVPFLGERIGVHRILSVCIGLAGVLLIIRPGTADFRAESVIVFGAALPTRCFQIWTRRLKAVGNLSAMVSVQQICYITAALPVLLVNLIWPRQPSDNVSLDFMLRAPAMPDGQELLFLGFCTLAVLLLSVASSNAYRSVEASIIAPFEYTAIPFAVIWGILIWNEWPDALSWAGMGLILAGGLYTVYRERQRAGRGDEWRADAGLRFGITAGRGRGALVFLPLPDAFFAKRVGNFAWHVGFVMLGKNIARRQAAAIDLAFGNDALTSRNRLGSAPSKLTAILRFAVRDDET